MCHVTLSDKTGKPFESIEICGGQGVATSIRTGRKVWADCAACGPVIPLKKNNGRGIFATAACSQCLGPATLRLITIRTARGAQGKECNGACLSGKKSCDCKCKGRCHGAGACRCLAN